MQQKSGKILFNGNMVDRAETVREDMSIEKQKVEYAQTVKIEELKVEDAQEEVKVSCLLEFKRKNKRWY